MLVASEAGSGKTTLVQALLARLPSDTPCWLAQGQCLDHFGAGEPHLPVLEALGRLCRGPEGARVVEVLHQYAPTWLLQIPSLLDTAALEALHRRILGATRERMLRELGEAVEVFSCDRLVVLVLEDLHWSDAATLDVLAWLAQRREPARLVLLGTYRPVDVIMRAHPLRGLTRSLTLRGQGVELPLELLTPADVAQYLTARFGTSAVAAALAREVHRRTSGNPLFMVTVVDTLLRQGVIWQEGERWHVQEGSAAAQMRVPESLRQMIEQQLDGLSDAEQRVLEAASVAGMVCSAAVVAAGVEGSGEAIEEQCANLARRGQFLEAAGVEEWPDGPVAGRYRFRHALCQEVVYERLTTPRCIRLHRQIGAHLEAAYGPRAREFAAELADHFARGRDDRRAVLYLRQAGENALRRWAYTEAVGHLTQGLAVLQRLPETPERVQHELDIQLTLASALLASKGLSTPEVGGAYTRVQALCEQIGATPQRFEVLRGLRRFYLGRAELPTVQALAEQQLQLARQSADPVLLVEARVALGIAALYQGELATARAQLEQGSLLYGTREPRAHGFGFGQDPGTACSPIWRWHSGCWAIRSKPYSRHRRRCAWRRYWGTPLAWRLPSIKWRLSTSCVGNGRQCRRMRRPSAPLPVPKDFHSGMILSMLAEAYALDGKVEAGLELLAEALDIVHTHGLRLWEAEVYRLRGALLLAQGSARHKTMDKQAQEAAACFQQALALARQRQARA